MILGEDMLNICKAVFEKNRTISLRAYPYSFMMSRITGGIFSVLLPSILYYYVFHENVTTMFTGYVGSNDYLSFIVLGQALEILSFATLMNVGRCLIGEIREGTIDNFLLSPASRMGYFFGAYLEQLGRSIIEYTVMLVFGICLGMKINMEKISILIVIFFIASIAFFSVAVTVSTIMVFTRDTYLTQNTMFLFMKCICGVLFPIEYMPQGIQYVANLLPLTPIIKLFRNCILLDMNLYENKMLLLQVFLLSMVYMVIGYFGFRKMEKKLIEEVLA